MAGCPDISPESKQYGFVAGFSSHDNFFIPVFAGFLSIQG
jgi:dolichol kinase